MALLLLAVGALHHRVCLHGLDHVLLGYTQLSRLCHSATRWHSSEVYLLGSWWRWWWCNRWNLIIWCLNIILVKSVKNWRLSTSILLFIMSAANLIAFIRVSKDILPPLLPPWIVSISCLNSGVDRPPAESVTGLELSCLEKYFWLVFLRSNNILPSEVGSVCIQVETNCCWSHHWQMMTVVSAVDPVYWMEVLMTQGSPPWLDS